MKKLQRRQRQDTGEGGSKGEGKDGDTPMRQKKRKDSSDESRFFFITEIISYGGLFQCEHRVSAEVY